MPSLICLMGLPGAGKTTRARLLRAVLLDAVIVARDPIRTQTQQTDELAITHVMRSRARTLLLFGFTVIVDDLNLDQYTRAGWEVMADRLGVEIRWEHLTTPVEGCIARDSLRAHPVGAAAIQAFAASAN